MKRLLIPLIASLVLPTALNAETWYLFASHSSGTHTISMQSKEACEKAGEKFWDEKGTNWTGFKPSVPGYICIKGK